MKILFRIELETRLDQALLTELRKTHPELSRASLKEAFRSGAIRFPASRLLPPGEHEIEIVGWDPVRATDRRAKAALAPDFLPAVYEDGEVLVLNKRSGIPSVPQDPEESETAVGAALARRPEIAEIGRGGFEPGILHRLDTGTSGLLAFAKTNESFERLRSAWKDGRVGKIYRALVRPIEGASPLPTNFPHLIDLPLGHDPSSDKRMVAMRTPKTSIRGKPLAARTEILSVREAAEGLFDLTIRIETGVMHQIRCHLASQGWPIQGDPVYRGTPSSRLWLHAWKLELPMSREPGSTLSLESELPQRWP